MKCNVRELAHLSDQPCVIEGRLNYKKIHNSGYRHQSSVFKERWFRLIKNYLFYFKISDMGKFDTKAPAGVFVMENSSIQMEHGQNISFSFSVSFIDEFEKKHLFAARSEDNVVQWVMKLRECSYEYLRNRLYALQSKIFSITGKDPLLLVPRNEGACLWAPAIPFSTVPACTINTSSFSCHLHTNSAFTLERSKSDAEAHRYFNNNRKQAKFYTNDEPKMEQPVPASTCHKLGLERSKTAALFDGRASPFNESIFDNRPTYSRAAPSPPVRTKLSLSPAMRRVESPEVAAFVGDSRRLGIMGIMDAAPVPPRRKLSPKHADVNSVNVDFTNGRNDSTSRPADEDLIKF